MATQTTSERYVRASGQWVKITRDPKAKTFTFARGYENEVKAHDVSTRSFAYVGNWADAVLAAERSIADWQ